MTARPIVPENRRRPLCAAVALILVMVAVLLAAGCIEPGYMPNSDIVIVKLTPNAIVEWSTILDSGGHDQAYRIIQTPDNNLAVYCSLKKENFVGLVKISRATGEILWKTSLLEKGCGSGLILGRNGDIISIGGANICRINSDGAVVLNRTTQFNGYAQSILETPDNGYIVGGGKTDWYESGTAILYDEYGNITPQLSEQEKRKKGIPITQTTVARLDANGNVIWQTFLGQENCRDPAVKLIDLGNDQGYVVRAGEKIIRLDKNGEYAGLTWVDDLPEFDNGSLTGQNLTQNLTYPPDFVFYNARGEAIAKETLKNITVAIRTNDGGYISAGFPGRLRLLEGVSERAQDGNLHVVKLKPDESKDWDAAIHGVLVNSVGQIIQTSDGGYALLCGNDKQWD